MTMACPSARTCTAKLTMNSVAVTPLSCWESTGKSASVRPRIAAMISFRAVPMEVEPEMVARTTALTTVLWPSWLVVAEPLVRGVPLAPAMVFICWITVWASVAASAAVAGRATTKPAASWSGSVRSKAAAASL
jgi:hypothetical protein